MSYKKYAIAGFSWQSIQKFLSAGVTFAKVYIIARLLTPNDIGLFSLTMIALGITESFTQTGINITMIQSKNPIRYYLSTAWVIAIIRGFVIGAIMVAMAFFMSQYYDQPDLLALISVTAFVPVLKGFINPAITSWQKDLDFYHDSLYSFIRQIAEVFFQILLAFALRSVWALALGVILSAAFEVLLSFFMLKERPVFLYIKSRGKEIFKNARWLNVASFLSYLNDNVDDFLLGKIVGTAKLGIYHNAYSLSHQLNYELSKSAHHGIMPIFSQINHTNDQERLNRAFRKSFWTLVLLVFAASFPLLAFPNFIVNFVLGDQWLAAIPLLRILTLAGIVHAISNFCYALMISRKEYRFLNSHMLLLFFLTAGGILWLGADQGLQGAVLAIFLARLFSLPIALIGSRQALKEKVYVK